MTNRSDDADDPLDSEDLEDDMFAHRERHDRFGGGERRQRPRVVTEFVRRAIENTVGSVQNTGSLSKDALNYLLQQGDRGKKELVRIVAHEVGEFLRGVDLSSEVIKVLSGIQIDVTTSVRFRPTQDGSVAPEIVSETNVSAGSDSPDPPPDRPDDPAPRAPQTADPMGAPKDARRTGEKAGE